MDGSRQERFFNNTGQEKLLVNKGESVISPIRIDCLRMTTFILILFNVHGSLKKTIIFHRAMATELAVTDFPASSVINCRGYERSSRFGNSDENFYERFVDARGFADRFKNAASRWNGFERAK